MCVYAFNEHFYYLNHYGWASKYVPYKVCFLRLITLLYGLITRKQLARTSGKLNVLLVS